MGNVPAFEFDGATPRVVFGAGTLGQLAQELTRLGVARAMLVGTRGMGERSGARLAEAAGIASVGFFEAEPHCPVDVVERCREVYRRSGCEGVVAIGGGSTLGLGKILAAEEGARFIALPTTSSGSEMTPIFGRKQGAEKRTQRNPACRPSTILYDPQLTTRVPAAVVGSTGMNCIAHAVEALYPARPLPWAPLLAEQALVAQLDALPAMIRGDAGPAARASYLYGGFLGGWLVATCGIALHHYLCHVIGGLYDLAHGEINAVVLPHAAAYNATAAPAMVACVCRVFGGDDAAGALFDFVASLGAPQGLRELGMPPEGIESVTTRLLAHAGWNPRPLDEPGIRRLVEDAFHGRRPGGRQACGHASPPAN